MLRRRHSGVSARKASTLRSSLYTRSVDAKCRRLWGGRKAARKPLRDGPRLGNQPETPPKRAEFTKQGHLSVDTWRRHFEFVPAQVSTPCVDAFRAAAGAPGAPDTLDRVGCVRGQRGRTRGARRRCRAAHLSDSPLSANAPVQACEPAQRPSPLVPGRMT